MNTENWLVVWQARGLLFQGLGITVMLFIVSSVAAVILGCALLYVLGGRFKPVEWLVRSYITVMRTLPFLVFVYLLYYGLPSAGVRLSALVAGLLGLTLYHAGYIAEILRGAMLMLPVGMLEAAYAHGYGRGKAFLRIVLPQLLMRSRSVLGNQAIIALKDTSFLSIITVMELTAAANAVQARYFIPVEAFVVAIGCYWAICLVIEAVVRHSRKATVRRGFESG